jgi:hypothetical protein
MSARAGKRRLRVTVELWNCWRSPRCERYADGSTSLFFGVGRLTWRRMPAPAWTSSTRGKWTVLR